MQSIIAGDAKAQIMIAVGRPDEIPDRRALIRSIEIKGPAPQYPIFPLRWPFRIQNRLLRIRPIPIIAPFIHIAMHIVKTKSVWFITSYNYGLTDFRI